MKPLKDLRGAPVPEITTEQLQRAGAFGVVVPRDLLEAVEDAAGDAKGGFVSIVLDGSCLLCGEREEHRHTLAELRAFNRSKKDGGSDADHE